MSPRNLLRSAGVPVATSMLVPMANATGLFRAYLSSAGADTNPCTLPQPCRLLPAALAAVTDGGEIWILDSANYNVATVVVGKSVSILAVPGTVGSVVASGGAAISVTGGSLSIALRNLVIVPLPASGGTDGVSLTGASTITIQNSVIANHAGHGVHVVGNGVVNVAK